MQKVYTDANVNDLKELAQTLNKYKSIFKLDTSARKAHFFAQSIQESGLNLSGALNGEDLNYWAHKLPITFYKFRKRNARGEAVDKNGNPTTDNKKNCSKRFSSKIR